MRRVLTAVLGLAACAAAVGQKTKAYTDNDRLYYLGKEMYDLRHYNTAFRYFESYMVGRSADRDAWYGEAQYYVASCAYETGRKDTRGRLEAFIRENPYSSHLNRAYFLQGSLYFGKGRYKEACKDYFAVCDAGKLAKEEQADYHFRNGYCLLQLKEYERAREEFGVLRDFSGSDTYSKSGKYYGAYIDYMEGRYDDALPVFIEMEGDEAYKGVVPYYMAQIYYKKNMDEKVLEYGLQIVDRNPENSNNTEIYRLIGECYFKRGDYGRTIEYLSKYAEGTEQIMRNNIYMLGISYCKIGEWAKAAEELQKVTIIDDEMGQNAYLNLGNAYLKIGEKAKARMCFEQAGNMEYDKKVQEEGMYNYALVVYEMSYSPFDETVTVFERFLERFPGSKYEESVYGYLMNVYLTTKNYEAAYASIERIKSENGQILKAKQRILYCLGVQSFAEQEYEKARDYFGKSLENRKYDNKIESQAYFWRGEANYRMKDYGAATRDFHSFVGSYGARNCDEFNISHYDLGYCYFTEKDYKSALTWFRKYINIEDKNKTLIADANNRIGDCYFIGRDFENAEKSYAKVYALKGSGADYACFQQGFVQGLQKNYKGKIGTLEKLIRTFPNSEYLADAMYEIGRSYVMMKDYNNAIATYDKLSHSYFHSPLSRKGKLQTAMLYDEMENFDQSVKIYKSLVEMFPNSEEAKTSLEGLKRIYFEKNDVQGYADYVENLGGIAKFELSEQDSLTYLAAEKLYLLGKYQEAINSFNKYIDKFPNSIFNESAHFYLGMSYFSINEESLAKKELELIGAQAGSVHAEDALMTMAEMDLKRDDYEGALKSLVKAQDIAQKVENRENCKLYLMRCYKELKKTEEAIAAANALIGGDKLDPNIYREALFTRAKAYEEKDETGHAVADYKTLATNCMDKYGAEAKFKVADYAFHEGNTATAEKEIFEFIEMNTPHQYWLAKSFVLLSDIYASQGKDFEAKEYLLSVKENYKGKDDIAMEIKARLDEIESREKTKVIE